MNPELIGGIELQEQFGFRLVREIRVAKDYNVCNIEARFGRHINDEERLKRAILVLKPSKEDGIEEIIRDNKGVFMADNWDIGCTRLVKHHIVTKGIPINIKPWRQPLHLEDKIEETIKNLIDNGIIKKCNSPWNTPMVSVWKKGKQEVRLCLDFRKLNAITERQCFPMPNVEDLLDKLNGAGYFSTIDLGNAYYQVQLAEESQEKTAFSTKEGQYCFTRMPFGIAAAPGTFQELMTKVLGNVKGAVVYLDDILVYSKSKTEHVQILEKVLKKIKEAELRVNPEKCHFLKKQVKYLGHIIDKEGIKTNPEKIEAIKLFGKPSCTKKLKSFLGICNYYRRFINNYAKKARILEKLSGAKNQKLVWTEECDKAFREMKEALMTTPVLGFPDINKEFILDTDASFESIGAVLSQKDDLGRERVIAYGSHTMNSHEKGYCVTRKELLAIYYFCNHFKHYLYGKQFLLRTDHKAITFMLSTSKPVTPQFQNWMNYLSSLDMRIEFRKGKMHTNADMLSRSDCGTCTQCLMKHEEAKSEKIKTRRLNNVETEEDYIWQKGSKEIQNIKDEIKSGKSWKFKLVNGIVVTTVAGKIWIPEDRKSEMIKAIHTMLSHAGAEKTLNYVTSTYGMNKIKDVVKEVIRNCQACQKSKTVTTATKEKTIHITANEPFEKIYIDVCGPFRESLRKKRYVVAMVDKASRYITLVAVARQDEETLKKTIKENWILRFGAPKEIHVDCGKTFESAGIKGMMESMGIKLCFSSPYHHNTNGTVERQFRTIRDYINASLQRNRRSEWSDIIPEIEFTMNATFQKTLGKSPAEIIFGRKLSRERFVSQGTFKRKDLLEPPRRVFQVGENVLVKVEQRSKEEDRFEGPYQIVGKVHDRRYKIKNNTGRVIERNVEKIKRFF